MPKDLRDGACIHVQQIRTIILKTAGRWERQPGGCAWSEGLWQRQLACTTEGGGGRSAFLKTYLHEHFRCYRSMSAFLQLSIEIPAHGQRFHELHAIICMPRPPAPPRICAHTRARTRTCTTTRSLSRTLTCRKRRAHAELLCQYHQPQSPAHVSYSQRCYIHCFSVCSCTQTSERGARCVDLRFQESP